GTVTDPYVADYGYNLDNTGRNAGSQYAIPDAAGAPPEGWEGGPGAGAIVAVVDTGYDSDHPELAGALWANPSCGSDADADGIVGDCHGGHSLTQRARDDK